MGDRKQLTILGKKLQSKCWMSIKSRFFSESRKLQNLEVLETAEKINVAIG